MSKKNLIGIYAIKGNKNKNSIKIKPIGNVESKDIKSIHDTLLKTYDISKNIKGDILACNITSAYLMMTKKLPVLYARIVLEKPLRRIQLCRFFLYFTIDEDIKDSRQLINNNVNGKFSIELLTGENKTILDEDVGKFPGSEEMIEKIIEITKSETFVNLAESLSEIENKKIEDEFRREFDSIKPPKPTISLDDYLDKDN